jgi:hypothetical protein
LIPDVCPEKKTAVESTTTKKGVMYKSIGIFVILPTLTRGVFVHFLKTIYPQSVIKAIDSFKTTLVAL